MEKDIRKCGFYCPHFSDIVAQSFCNYKIRDFCNYKIREQPAPLGADCMYGLKEVSEKRRREVESKLEKELKSQKKSPRVIT